MKDKPILCVDFDGVIHSYTSGWKGPTVISDPVVPGFFEWLDAVTPYFRVVIYSSRSKEPGGREAMANWIDYQHKQWQKITNSYVTAKVEFAHEKPSAFLTIDDRAICFDGKWPSVPEMVAFKPWYKR